MELTKDQLDALEDFCEENEYDLRDNYSGRFMSGRGCIGIVTDDNPFDVAMRMVEAAEYDENFPLEVFKEAQPRMDSMGLSSIIYFPRIKASEVEA